MRLFLLVFFCILTSITFAQTVQDTNSSSRIIVEIADNFKYTTENGVGVKYLNGNVRMYQDSTFMYCDTAILTGNELIAFGNVVIIQSDTVNIFADSLQYNGDNKVATLFNNVILESKTRKLFSDYLVYDLNTRVGSYTKGALLQNKGTEIKSLIGKYFVNEEKVRFYKNVSVVDDDFKLWADSLAYDSEQNITYFLGPTRINQDSSKIYCEDGFYDIDNEVAEFRKNAEYIQGDKIANGDLIKYDARQKMVLLAGNAEYNEGATYAKADTIQYFEKTEDTRLIGNAFYEDENRNMKGARILYNAKNESFKSEGRSTIVDSSTVLTADHIDFSQETDFGIATGNVELIDTSSKTTIFSDTMEYKKNENYSKAYSMAGNRPLLQTILEGDSMFMKSDTLLTYEEIDSVGKKSILKAYHDVRLYKSNLQAMCDSMTFNSTDSILSMYDNPIIWSDSSQFTADTIDIFMRNDELYKVVLKNKAFIINTEDSIYYNQIKGKLVEVYFVDGALDSMSVTGNAESVYFMMDEQKAYIGMNKSISSKMSFTFEDSDLKDIYFYVNVNSNLIPMKDVNPNETLDGFNWQPRKRPKDKEAL